MNSLRYAIAVLGVFSLFAQAVRADSLWKTDLAEARREAERLNRPILCHFGAKWCAPCQKMERTVFNQPSVMNQLRSSVVGLKIDVDEHPELAQRFGVERFPTDVFLEPNGQRLLTSTGYQSADEYRNLIDRAGRRYSDLLASRKSKSGTPVLSKNDERKDPAQLVKSTPSMLMMEGYCPVTLQKFRRWVKGDPQFTADHKGQLYYFASAECRDEFRKSPDHFVPQMLGCDPVIIYSTDRAVPGSIEWGAFYDQRLYLFSSEENRRKFKETPDKYIDSRLVFDVSQIETEIR